MENYGFQPITPHRLWRNRWNPFYCVFGLLPVFAMDDGSKALWYLLKSKGYRPNVTYCDSHGPECGQTPILSITLG